MALSRDSLELIIADYTRRRINRRQFFQRAAVLGLSMTAIGTLLAACEEEEEAPATPTATATPEVEAVPGGTLREGYDRDPQRMDPVTAFWWDAAEFPATHETLLTADPDGNFVGMLAESWEVSEDGLTWTFKLRDGLKFHSGAPADAQAVAAAMEVFRDPAAGAVNYGFWAPVSKVSAGEGNTVVMTLDHPYADLPFVLNNGYSAVYNKATWDQLGGDYGVTGEDSTGPFVLKEYVPGSHLLVERWEEYPGSILPFVRNKGKAYLDAVRWVTLLEPATRGLELEAGNIDALHGPAPQDVDRLKDNPDLSVIELQEWSQYILGLNFTKTEFGFDDVRVRQALSHAVDRQAIVDAVFFGKAVTSFALVSAAFPWYEPEVEKLGEFDPDKSKTLLDEAGWVPGGDGIREKDGNRLSFTIVVEEDVTEKLVAQAVQQMYKDVGVEMNFTALEIGAYFEEVGKGPEGGPEGYMFKSLWPYLIDASLLFFHSKYFAPSCCNWSLTNIPELDAAFDDWQNAANEAELEAASRKAQLVGAEQVAFVPILTPLNVWVHHKRVHGWIPTQPNLYPFYNDVWMEA